MKSILILALAQVRQRASKPVRQGFVSAACRRHKPYQYIDEADRFKPKTFAEVRDIYDNLPEVLLNTNI